MTSWEYIIVALPAFQEPTNAPGASAAVEILNRQGRMGWEAIGMTALGSGAVAVLCKKPTDSQ